ncbi:lysophospholipid acyltransferase family protein [Dechloromonas denitrificans]|uniref:lysophospholipid acyltransferase family protein n=1 Tax=Dechloromonas denitrificans TaxID=281362 RepID=UPI0009F8DAE8|nr:lipid A biosynthesis acyltransferase [Dechloromonas denitrificans]
MKLFFTYILVGFLWLLHWLPLPFLRGLGWLLGRLLYALGRERRKVALINLRLCFPEKSEAEREDLARRHFVAFSRAVLDRTLGWWASKERLERIIRIQGAEHLNDPEGKPIILLSPHFVGLDAGATRISMYVVGCSVYSNQKNPVFNKLLYDGRKRFNDTVLFSRQEGMRGIIKAMKAGHQFYYLPDMDFGPKESIFVPFFGVQAATIPGVARLVRLTGAKVVACITRQVADGYEVEVMPAWDNFPGDSVEEDTAFVNRFIESQVLRMPEQYFWLHKRFKTRPPGEQRFYK